MELLSPLELSTVLQSKTINKILLCINKTIELQNKKKNYCEDISLPQSDLSPKAP